MSETPQGAVEVADEIWAVAKSLGPREMSLMLKDISQRVRHSLPKSIRDQVLGEVERELERRAEKEEQDAASYTGLPSTAARNDAEIARATYCEVLDYLATLQKDEPCENCGGVGSYVTGDAPHDEHHTYREPCPDCTPEDQESNEGSGAPLVEGEKVYPFEKTPSLSFAARGNDSYELCGNCGGIQHASEWIDDECPHCRFRFAEDDDAGPCTYGGTLSSMLEERAALLADEDVDWKTLWEEAMKPLPEPDKEEAADRTPEEPCEECGVTLTLTRGEAIALLDPGYEPNVYDLRSADKKLRAALSAQEKAEEGS